MNFVFKNKKISGILSIVPKKELLFEDEISNYNFSEKKCLKLKKIMGYDKHRIVDENICISDLCIFGLKYLFDKGLLYKNEIDALVLITQTPDYFIPPTSNVIQGKLGLKQNMICLDINQGCSGYLIGLMEAFNLLEHEEITKVVLINADILSKKVSNKDRNSYPLVGDAASITIVERDSENSNIYGNLKMDGSRGEALIIPGGGLKTPYSSESSKLEVDEYNNERSKNHLKMDGKAIFNFVLSEVPPLIDSLLEFATVEKDIIDYFMFHQPNKFILQKLADKMNIIYEKMPNNIVGNFGNSSGVTIPLNISFNIGTKLKENSYNICIAGFGAGLTWSSMLMNIGKLDFCEIIEF